MHIYTPFGKFDLVTKDSSLLSLISESLNKKDLETSFDSEAVTFHWSTCDVRCEIGFEEVAQDFYLNPIYRVSYKFKASNENVTSPWCLKTSYTCIRDTVKYVINKPRKLQPSLNPDVCFIYRENWKVICKNKKARECIFNEEKKILSPTELHGLIWRMRSRRLRSTVELGILKENTGSILGDISEYLDRMKSVV